MTPTPTPTPTPSPTPTPCPQGSFDPNADGSCPNFAYKSVNCCVCYQTNHTCPQGCFWIEHLCGCYNAFGPCGAPTPTPTPPPNQNCTTAGWNGDCPPGTQPDGFGWCCAEAGCGGFYATQEKSSGQYPTSNIINPSCCDDWQRLQCYQGGAEWYESQCACYSPVVIDVAGNGFNLTNAANGVMFDLPGGGVAERLSWTSANSDDAWLALDRNGNGIIDNGKELFGTFTAQPALAPGESKNGFRALAMFDTTAFGGNADGQIDSRDAIFPNLRLWQDRNHNGLSEADELRSLSGSDIGVLQLSYKESRRKDANGNWFRYRAKVTDVNGAQAGRWAWDVFLQKP